MFYTSMYSVKVLISEVSVKHLPATLHKQPVGKSCPVHIPAGSYLLTQPLRMNFVDSMTIPLNYMEFLSVCRRGMLKVHKSNGLGDLGAPEWDVTLCLMLSYTIIYFATWKGVKTSGKVNKTLYST